MKKRDVILKNEELLKLNIMTPRNDFIKEEDEIKALEEAGRLNELTLSFAVENLKPGMSTYELANIVYLNSIAYGKQFDYTLCISVNDCVAHGTASKSLIIKDTDVVKIDMTTLYNGYYGDACRSISLDKSYTDDINKLNEIMKRVVDSIIPYKTYIGDIGYLLNKEIEAMGYHVIVELMGHGIGKEMHEEPMICHKAEPCTDYLITPNMVFTIEPAITKGSTKIKELKKGIYTKDKSLSLQVEYTIAVDETKAYIISK